MAWWGGLALATALVAAEALPKLEDLRLDAFEPEAGEAVFRFPDGRLEPVLEGKSVGNTGAKLLEVLVDRVVLERESRQAGILEKVWMFPAEERGKPSRVQVLSLVPPQVPDPPSPTTVTIDETASPPPV
ncbi:MAG: hypothetical protein SF066_06450 [Thermoanaerobaculia bacterium]|nr:hypothetical protein [Thermoanaerobaculia bacterium]